MRGFLLMAATFIVALLVWPAKGEIATYTSSDQAGIERPQETAFIFRRIRQRRANGQGFRPIRSVGRLFARSC